MPNNLLGGNSETNNNKLIKKQYDVESMKRVTACRVLLREMECDEGSALSFRVKNKTIIGSCARDMRTTTSRLLLLQCVVLILTYVFYMIDNVKNVF